MNGCSYHIYLRMLGYIATIVLHGGNMFVMGLPKPKEIADDPRIKMFGSMQARYLTVWTFFLQVTFAISGLWCDLLTLKNSWTKDYKLPKYLRGFRDTLFAAIVWPSVFVVLTMFWIPFLYDRSLIFPEFMDKVVTPLSNHIMHTLIVPLAVWELLFQQRSRPKSHLRNCLHIAFHFVLYLGVLLYTYYEKGHWLYPMYGKMYGTIYFPLCVITVGVLAYSFYFMQWPLTEMVWGQMEKSKKKNR